MSRGPSASIFIVRAWFEHGELRARVSRCADPGSQSTTSAVTANRDEIAQLLTAWLADVDRQQDPLTRNRPTDGTRNSQSPFA